MYQRLELFGDDTLFVRYQWVASSLLHQLNSLLQVASAVANSHCFIHVKPHSQLYFVSVGQPIFYIGPYDFAYLAGNILADPFGPGQLISACAFSGLARPVLENL